MTVGGVAGRYWVGEPGRSALVGGRLDLYVGVPVPDREQVTEELKARLLREIRRGIWEQTGLLLQEGNERLDRIEWLALVGDPDQEAGPRMTAFLEGWSSVLPQGVRARDLSSQQVQQLGRQVLGRLPNRGQEQVVATTAPPKAAETGGLEDSNATNVPEQG